MSETTAPRQHVTVLGCGRWGTFHAWYADHIGHETLLWGRPGSRHLQELQQEHRNAYLELPSSVRLTDDLDAALRWSDTVVISISSQQLRGFCRQLREIAGAALAGKTLVLCMKGLEQSTGKRLTTVVREELGADQPVAVWVGPGHVQDFVQGIPNCMVIASPDMELTKRTAAVFASPLIRFYYGEDLLGTEIGAAAKNVIGLAAGMLDGFGYTSLKGALMARGTRELSRLVEAMGGDKMTVYGLSHLGDYQATLFSEYSNNRRFGEDLIRKRPFTKLAEGVGTVEALVRLGEKYSVDLPICRTVYRIIYDKADPRQQLTQLFLRPRKAELA